MADDYLLEGDIRNWLLIFQIAEKEQIIQQLVLDKEPFAFTNNEFNMIGRDWWRTFCYTCARVSW